MKHKWLPWELHCSPQIKHYLSFCHLESTQRSLRYMSIRACLLLATLKASLNTGSRQVDWTYNAKKKFLFLISVKHWEKVWRDAYYYQDEKKIILEKSAELFYKQDTLQNHVMKIKNMIAEHQGAYCSWILWLKETLLCSS